MEEDMDDKKELGKENTKSDEIYRIAVTRDAEKALNELMEKVNYEFDGGKVNRSEMASWALIRLCKGLNDEMLQDIRSEHFDEVTALESLYRRAKETGKVSVELKALLLKQVGFDGSAKKSVKVKIDK